MNKSQELLSDIVVYNKYARYRPDLKRRETWEEIVDRYIAMMLKKYCGVKYEKQFKKNKKLKTKKGSLAERIILNAEFLYKKKVMPSMRACQFSGPAIERNHSRIYNCSYLPIDSYTAFSEVMMLLLGGTGVGFSVQEHHVEQLPEISKPQGKRKFLIADDIIGWADAVKALMKAYFGINKMKPRFDYSGIREKGEPLVTAGGKAPGPDPLRIGLTKIEAVLNNKEDGEKLTPLECHDILCHIADAVLAGGIRRAALISLFSPDDIEMSTCKTGNWWELNPQRGRSNNSALMHRDEIDKETFDKFFEIIKDSNSGEPGIVWTSDDEKEYGTNPCKPLDATILTTKGYITFREALEYEELEIITPSGNITKASKPFMTGVNKDVYEIKMSNGLKLLGTEEHEHQLQDGTWKPVSKLENGDRIKISNTSHYDTSFDAENEDYKKGVVHGWMLGDGWNFKRSDSADCYRAGLSFGKNEFDCISYLEDITGSKSYPHNQKPETCKILRVPQNSFGFTDKWKLPFLKSKQYKLGFIRALFTTDGSVRPNNNSVELYSIDKTMLKGVNLILQEFGIRSTVTTHNKARTYVAKDGKTRNNKTTYKLNVYAGQYKRIGFLSKYKTKGLEQLEDKGLSVKVDYETVKSVELRSKEDVYDIEVFDDEHAFTDNGFSTHNCSEVSLPPNVFCNLTEINGGTVRTQKDFNERCRVASFFGTLQAGFTDLHYLRHKWVTATEKDALIGVGITGICNGNILPLDLKEAADFVKKENEIIANEIGINTAARCTTVKPSGSTSSVLSCSSGIHAWHSPYYIRNVQCRVGDDLYNYFTNNHPELIKVMDYDPQSAVIGCPMKAPDNAILRENETAIDFLERVKRFNMEWVRNGHRRGPNHNNVSATCNVRENEWDDVKKWMWDNRETYYGISLLPYDGGSYKDAPFQDCTEKEYNRRMRLMEKIDLTKINEHEDNTDLKGELACAGGACELVY